MISFSGHRSTEADAIMKSIQSREWGMLLMDEVHVVPANTFLTCTTRTKSRCKLGLTATLVREDGKIEDLYFLIGPKLCAAWPPRLAPSLHGRAQAVRPRRVSAG